MSTSWGVWTCGEPTFGTPREESSCFRSEPSEEVSRKFDELRDANVNVNELRKFLGMYEVEGGDVPLSESPFKKTAHYPIGGNFVYSRIKYPDLPRKVKHNA